MKASANPHLRDGTFQCLRQIITRQGLWFIVRAVLAILMFELLQHATASDHHIQDWVSCLVNHVCPALRPKNEVVVVRLSEESRRYSKNASKEIDGPYFPRDLLADIVEEVAKAKPGAIVLDMFLDETNYTTAHIKLSAAIHDAGNVLLAQDIKSCGKGLFTIVPTSPLFATNILAGGPSFFQEDEDGVVRRVPLRLEANGQSTLSLPVLAASRAIHYDWQHGPRTRRISFHYATTNAFKSVTAEGILLYHRNGLPSVFPVLSEIIASNTIVVIAPFYATSHDIFRVPDRFGDEYSELRGGYLLAFAIQTLIHAGGGREPGIWMVNIIGIVAFLCGFGFVFIHLSWPCSGVCNWRFIPPAGYVIFASLLVAFGLFLPLSQPFVAYMLGLHLGELYWARFGLHKDIGEAPTDSIEEKQPAT